MRHRWKAIAVILLTVVTASLTLAGLTARPAPDHPYFRADGASTAVIAHRGGAALRPENTLAAFTHAVELGTDILEMDVRGTADGAIVCIHDVTVDRTTNGSGTVSSFTLEALRKLDAAYHWSTDGGRTFPLRGTGIRVPELAEVFSRFPETRMNIEIKRGEPDIASGLCSLIRKFGMSARVLVAAFDHDTISAFRRACPEVASSLSGREARILHAAHRVMLDRAYSPPVPALQIPDRIGDTIVTTPKFIDAARRRNLKVYVWTINDEQRARELADLGVHGIITDRPDALLRLFGRARHSTR